MTTQEAWRTFDAEAETDTAHIVATEWLLRLRDSDITPEEILAWQAWMSSDPRHAAAFRRMEEVGDLLRDVPRPHSPTVGELSRDHYDASVTLKAWKRRPWYLTLPIATAAAVLVATIAVMLIPTRRDEVMTTRVGENRTASLADGSIVTLGGHSRIRVRFDAHQRRIELLQGEALFRVAADPNRPLGVIAGRAIIVALGTAFNVRYASDRVVVDVVEGKVAVMPRTALTDVPILSALAPKLTPVNVTAGEETTVGTSEVGPATAGADIVSATSWTSGQLAFRMQPLSEVLQDVNRYSPKPIVAAPDVAVVKITGTVSGKNVTGWLSSLNSALGIRADEEPDRIVLRKAR